MKARIFFIFCIVFLSGVFVGDVWGMKPETTLKMAQQLMETGTLEDKFAALIHFQNFVKNKKYYKEAFEAAQQAMKNKDLQSNALDIFKELIEKKQYYTKIIDVAVKAFDDFQEGAHLLFTSLIQKGQGYTEMIDAIEKKTSGPGLTKTLGLIFINLYETLETKLQEEV